MQSIVWWRKVVTHSFFTRPCRKKLRSWRCNRKGIRKSQGYANHRHLQIFSFAVPIYFRLSLWYKKTLETLFVWNMFSWNHQSEIVFFSGNNFSWNVRFYEQGTAFYGISIDERCDINFQPCDSISPGNNYSSGRLFEKWNGDDRAEIAACLLLKEGNSFEI